MAKFRIRVRTSRVIQLAWAWCLLVSIFVLWQGFKYQGLMRRAEEWEFDKLRAYYPNFTTLLLIALLSSPLLFWALLAQRRRANIMSYAPSDPLLVIRRAKRFAGALAAISAGLLIAAAVMFGIGAIIRGQVGPPTSITLGTPASARPNSTLATLHGDLLYNRETKVDMNALVVQRSLRLAPIVPAGTTPTALQYFIELDPSTKTLRSAKSYTGYLRAEGLPAGAAALYRAAGYSVADHPYVLFRDQQSATQPYTWLAVRLLIVSVLIGMAALFQYWRVRRITRPAE